MDRIPGFLESDEQSALQRLCDAFFERDGEAVVAACGDIVFRSMETDVCMQRYIHIVLRTCSHTNTCTSPYI